jgi:hypothetical protein
MLIIAIPKSASTSLLSTLGSLHNADSTQLLFPGLQESKHFSQVGKYHSDIRIYPPELLHLYCESPAFFKQHIPPEASHISALSDKKKVVLLRPVDEVIESYHRAEIARIHPPRPEFRGAKTKREWMERASEIGLTDDLHKFHLGWKHNEGSNTMIIESGALIAEPGETIRKIERFFELPVSRGDIQLRRERYSRESLNRNILQRIVLASKAAYREFKRM